MTIEDMHYDFKKKLNKVDSQANRNLLIPEIDWALNEAMMVFISKGASPRGNIQSGIESEQRVRDDLYPLIVKDAVLPLVGGAALFPDDYMFFLRAKVLSDSSTCSNVESRLIMQQYDDMFEESPFTRSSLEWREVNAVFSSKGIETFNDGTFENTHIILSYIRRPAYMHYAEGFSPGGYRMPSGLLLEGSVDCELPEHVHREIVDIAVALTSGELGYPDAQARLQKVVSINDSL